MRQFHMPVLVVSVSIALLLGASAAVQLVLGEVAFQQAGSPLQILSVSVSVNYIYEDVTLRNAGDKTISGVWLGIVGYDEGNPSQRILIRSKATDLSLAPGTTAKHMAKLLPIDEFADMTSHWVGAPRFQLGVLSATFADGTSWSYKLPDDALVFVPNNPAPRGVPRAQVSQVVPSSGDGSATCLDDKGKKFSHGEVSPVTGEAVQFARCVYGTWVDYARVRTFPRISP